MVIGCSEWDSLFPFAFFLANNVGFVCLVATCSKSRGWRLKEKRLRRKSSAFHQVFSPCNKGVFRVVPLNVWADAQWLEMISYFLLGWIVQMDLLPWDSYRCAHWDRCPRTVLLAGIMQTAFNQLWMTPASFTLQNHSQLLSLPDWFCWRQIKEHRLPYA